MSVESHTGLIAFGSGLRNGFDYVMDKNMWKIGLAGARGGAVRVNTLGGGLARAAQKLMTLRTEFQIKQRCARGEIAVYAML